MGAKSTHSEKLDRVQGYKENGSEGFKAKPLADRRKAALNVLTLKHLEMVCVMTLLHCTL